LRAKCSSPSSSLVLFTSGLLLSLLPRPTINIHPCSLLTPSPWRRAALRLLLLLISVQPSLPNPAATLSSAGAR
jgi:hypothetical protein